MTHSHDLREEKRFLESNISTVKCLDVASGPPRVSESSSGPRTFFGLPFHVFSVEIHFVPPPGNVVTTLRRDECAGTISENGYTLAYSGTEPPCPPHRQDIHHMLPYNKRQGSKTKAS